MELRFSHRAISTRASHRFHRHLVSVAASIIATIGFTTAAIVSAQAAPAGSATTIHNTTSSTSCLQPPSNVDLTTLSDEQLAAYGLPPRPSEASGLPHWRRMLRHAKHRWCTEQPSNIRHTSKETSKNWAGNISIGGGYTAVVADWYVPCVADTPRSATEAMWVGLGGDGNDGGGNLVQMGTESDVDSSGFITTYAWWEVVGAQGQNVANFTLSSFPVSCLNSMTAEVYNSTTGAGCGWIENNTNGAYQPECTAGWPSNGSTAEWIVERTSSCTTGCNPGALANFSPEEAQFTSAQANHNGWSYVGNTSHNYAVMYNNALSMQCAHPGPISSDGSSFYLYYDVPSGHVCA